MNKIEIFIMHGINLQNLMLVKMNQRILDLIVLLKGYVMEKFH